MTSMVVARIHGNVTNAPNTGPAFQNMNRLMECIWPRSNEVPTKASSPLMPQVEPITGNLRKITSTNPVRINGAAKPTSDTINFPRVNDIIQLR
jgi:hypothetical protein